jgi:hypothetical protein
MDTFNEEDVKLREQLILKYVFPIYWQIVQHVENLSIEDVKKELIHLNNDQ